MNRIIIRQGYNERYPTKNILFDTQSLTNQLYQSRLTILDRLELGKIYFSKNLVPDLWDKGIN